MHSHTHTHTQHMPQIPQEFHNAAQQPQPFKSNVALTCTVSMCDTKTVTTNALMNPSLYTNMNIQRCLFVPETPCSMANRQNNTHHKEMTLTAPDTKIAPLSRRPRGRVEWCCGNYTIKDTLCRHEFLVNTVSGILLFHTNQRYSKTKENLI